MIEDSAQAVLAREAIAPPSVSTPTTYPPSSKSSTNGSTNGSAPAAPNLSVAQSVVKLMEELGIDSAFGVSGGAMATLWGAMSDSDRIEVIHCRHESGATFAASEASLATNKPVTAFSTAGPGLTNALTGMFAARGEGAKVLLISACTSAPQQGRWAIQETSALTLPTAGLFTSGALFNYATVVQSAEQLPQIARRLALGFSQPEGFVAHLSFPTAVQAQPVKTNLPEAQVLDNTPNPSDAVIKTCAKRLAKAPFAIWLGYGARHAAKEILELAEKTGAAVMCSPRGKGVFPESHPQYLGVTGLGGHGSVFSYMQEQKPLWTLVLGTRLGEPTSFWSQSMVPQKGFIHVDIDSQVPGVAYSWVETLPVQADIGAFVRALMPQLDALQSAKRETSQIPTPERDEVTAGEPNCVRPEILMQMIQQEVVESSDAVVLAESGNSFTWSTNLLRFDRPNRYRVSTGAGSMGHAVTGVVGAAYACNGKAVAITGDGSMLMNNEISTAVKYNIPAVWIVLNDARYNMCFQGMALLGLNGDALMPQTDFVMIARGMGADGIHVTQESELKEALAKAMAASGPFVVDVRIDASRQAPSKGRNQSLVKQGAKTAKGSELAAAEPADAEEEPVSFPLV